MADTKEKESFSSEKQHYNTLISIFKYMVGAITILAAMAAWIIGSSVSDIKKDVAGELEKLNIEIVAMRKESQRSIKASSEEAEKQIEHLRKNTEAFLNLTKDITAMQISTLREDAKNLALSSARLRIEEAFKANDIQLLVETAAKNEIGDRLDEIVEREINKTISYFDVLPLLTTAYDRIRQGDRASFDQLDSIVQHSDNQIIKRAARELLLQKGIDYGQFIKEFGTSNLDKSVPFTSILAKIDSNLTVDEKGELISELVNIILNDKNLTNVTYSFILLRKVINQDIRIFDMEFIRNFRK